MARSWPGIRAARTQPLVPLRCCILGTQLGGPPPLHLAAHLSQALGPRLLNLSRPHLLNPMLLPLCLRPSASPSRWCLKPSTTQLPGRPKYSGHFGVSAIQGLGVFGSRVWRGEQLGLTHSLYGAQDPTHEHFLDLPPSGRAGAPWKSLWGLRLRACRVIPSLVGRRGRGVRWRSLLGPPPSTVACR